MDNFYKLYHTPCEQYAVIGTMDTTNITFHREKNCWEFSFFIECKDRVQDLVDFTWVHVSIRQGKIITIQFEKNIPLKLPEETFLYILDQVGVVRNFIDSAKVFCLFSDLCKTTSHLPEIEEFIHHPELNRVLVQFVNHPFVLEITLKPAIGMVSLSSFYSIAGLQSYGCLLYSEPVDFFGQVAADELTRQIKEQIKLRYFF